MCHRGFKTDARAKRGLFEEQSLHAPGQNGVAISFEILVLELLGEREDSPKLVGGKFQQREHVSHKQFLVSFNPEPQAMVIEPPPATRLRLRLRVNRGNELCLPRKLADHIGEHIATFLGLLLSKVHGQAGNEGLLRAKHMDAGAVYDADRSRIGATSVLAAAESPFGDPAHLAKPGEAKGAGRFGLFP